MEKARVVGNTLPTGDSSRLRVLTSASLRSLEFIPRLKVITIRKNARFVLGKDQFEISVLVVEKGIFRSDILPNAESPSVLFLFAPRPRVKHRFHFSLKINRPCVRELKGWDMKVGRFLWSSKDDQLVLRNE